MRKSERSFCKDYLTLTVDVLKISSDLELAVTKFLRLNFPHKTHPRTVDHICDTSYLVTSYGVNLHRQTNYHNLTII